MCISVRIEQMQFVWIPFYSISFFCIATFVPLLLWCLTKPSIDYKMESQETQHESSTTGLSELVLSPSVGHGIPFLPDILVEVSHHLHRIAQLENVLSPLTCTRNQSRSVTVLTCRLETNKKQGNYITVCYRLVCVIVLGYTVCFLDSRFDARNGADIDSEA